jgi:uncharacterized protein with HEPN domain
MRRTIRDYLEDMLSAAREVLEFTHEYHGVDRGMVW